MSGEVVRTNSGAAQGLTAETIEKVLVQGNLRAAARRAVGVLQECVRIRGAESTDTAIRIHHAQWEIDAIRQAGMYRSAAGYPQYFHHDPAPGNHRGLYVVTAMATMPVAVRTNPPAR